MSTTRKSKYLVPVLAAGVIASSCGKKSDDEEAPAEPSQGSTISMAGSLNVTTTTSAELLLSGEQEGFQLGDPQSADAQTLATYRVVCTAMGQNGDVVTVTSDVDGNGKFNVAGLAGAGNAVNCTVIDSSDAVVAEFVFENPSSKGLDGSNSLSSRVRPIKDVDFGTISADGDKGKAVVDLSKFASQFASKNFEDVWNPTGKWKFVKADSSRVPTGYNGVCSKAEAEAERKNNSAKRKCEGPTEGEVVWMRTIEGKRDDGSKGFAISVWTSEDSFKGCGSKLGMSYTDAKKQTGIDFSGSGVSEGSYDWTAKWSDGWKHESATTNYQMNNCFPTTHNGVPVFKCVASDGKYNLGVQGGCVDSSNKPVKVEGNWSSVLSNTSNSQSTDSKTGLTKNTMKATYNGKAITCVHIGDSFNSDKSKYNGGVTPETLAAQGAACSSISTATDPGKLAQLRCYADYYNRKRDDARGSSQCIRRVETDWTAEKAEKFVKSSDGPARATNEHVKSLMNYTDKNTLTFTDEDSYTRGVNVNGQWIGCEVRDGFTMTLRKVSDTAAEGEFITVTKLVDKGKAACSSNIDDSVMRFYVKMEKQ